MTCVCYYCIHFIGLPPRYRDSVRAITPGLPLFLYNYTTHQLHGIFEVCSHLFLFIAFISFEILLVVQGQLDCQIFCKIDYHIIIFPIIWSRDHSLALDCFIFILLIVGVITDKFYLIKKTGKCCIGHLLLYFSCLSMGTSLWKEHISSCWTRFRGRMANGQ